MILVLLSILSIKGDISGAAIVSTFAVVLAFVVAILAIVKKYGKQTPSPSESDTTII